MFSPGYNCPIKYTLYVVCPVRLQCTGGILQCQWGTELLTSRAKDPPRQLHGCLQAPALLTKEEPLSVHDEATHVRTRVRFQC